MNKCAKFSFWPSHLWSPRRNHHDTCPLDGSRRHRYGQLSGFKKDTVATWCWWWQTIAPKHAVLAVDLTYILAAAWCLRRCNFPLRFSPQRTTAGGKRGRAIKFQAQSFEASFSLLPPWWCFFARFTATPPRLAASLSFTRAGQTQIDCGQCKTSGQIHASDPGQTDGRRPPVGCGLILCEVAAASRDWIFS